MKNVRPAIFFSFALAIAGATAEAATISGSVAAEHDGAALAGMVVSVYSTAGAHLVSVTTDGAGDYSVGIGAGQYRLLAYDFAGRFATSFYNEARSFDSSAIVSLTESATVEVSFRLLLAGFMTGTVTAAENQSPLAGMVVAAYDSQGFLRSRTTSGGTGNFRFVLPPETYRIAAWDDSSAYAVQFFSGKASYSAADAVKVSAGVTTRSINFALQRPATISGSVIDSVTGMGLPSMTVEAWLDGQRVQQGSTDASGHYSIVVPPASLRLLAFDPAGIYASIYDGGAASFETTPLRAPAPGGSIDDVNFSLVKGGRVEGVLKRASSGAALPSLAVGAFNADGSLRSRVESDAAGSYSLLVPPGSYVIGAWDSRLHYLERFHPDTRNFAEAVAVPVTSSGRTGGIDFYLTETGRVTGQVRSSADMQPLADIRAYLYDFSGREIASSRTGSDGTFLLAAEPGTYRLVAADPGRVFATSWFDQAKNFETATAVTLIEGTEVDVAFTLRVAGTVEGSVHDQVSGLPLRGLYVAAHDLSGVRIAQEETGLTGAYSLLLPPGSYAIVAADPHRRYATSWYDGAGSFHTAKQIQLGGGIVWPIRFDLQPQTLTRRRPVRPAPARASSVFSSSKDNADR